KAGDGLTPIDIVKFTTGYGRWLLTTVSNGTKCKVVVGRDARISGQMVQSIVTSTLSALGIDVVCLQLST
ncbi:MAG TPA: phosphoglucosamine mutase, partial [Bacteroidia bacterium]|nr:phosphoglucosamine mutase [Bacteroidia bacterium]